MSSLILKSASFNPGGTIPKRHTCDGDDASPPLAWEGLPEKAATVALIMDDPDAPGGVWVHWVIYDVPAELGSLPERLPKAESLPNGAKQGLCWGVDRFERVGYHGPCPPPGAPHRYIFRLYAIDGILGLPPEKTKDELVAAMRGRILAQTELVGRYGR